MTDYNALVEKRNIARTELDAGTLSLLTLADKLKEGVSYEESVIIIDQFWCDRDAKQLKAKLFNSFPKRNGDLISEHNIDARVAERLSIITSIDFFKDIFEFIQQEMIRLQEKFKGVLTEDQEAFNKYLDYRKVAAKYIAFLDSGTYDVEDVLLRGCSSWDQLPGTVESIEDTSYLLWDNLAVEVSKAQGIFKQNQLDRKDYISLSYLKFCFNAMIAGMELNLLFAKTLSDM